VHDAAFVTCGSVLRAVVEGVIRLILNCDQQRYVLDRFFRSSTPIPHAALGLSI
jgi:hypothetical protein